MATTCPDGGDPARTNGSRILAIDVIRSTAKRFRDLVADYARDLGGEASLTAAEGVLVRQAAVVTVSAEQMQAALLNGATVVSDNGSGGTKTVSGNLA